MATKEFILYNGKEYVKVIAEPEYKDGFLTGHYKELKREFISINGILDDKIVLEEFKNAINDFRMKNISNFYLLESEIGEPKIFTTYSLAPEFPSLGDAIINYFLNDKNWVIQSYETLEHSIIFTIFIRETNSTFKLALNAATAITFN